MNEQRLVNFNLRKLVRSLSKPQGGSNEMLLGPTRGGDCIRSLLDWISRPINSQKCPKDSAEFMRWRLKSEWRAFSSVGARALVSSGEIGSA